MGTGIMHRLALELPLMAIIGIVAGADPEAEMSAQQIITHWKYPFEEHIATTKDGYVLSLYRIPYGRYTRCASIGPPIVLAHGLGASADHWLLNPPPSSPPFILADAGFDVWLVNFRGSKHSRRHRWLAPNGSAFWDFTWDQMSEFDLPAMIKKIRQVNGARQVYYVGHSQGTTVLFGKLARQPSFARKIARFFALAPITSPRRVSGPMAGLFFLRPWLQHMHELSGGMQFVLPTQFMANLMSKVVCDYAPMGNACESFVAMQGGPSFLGNFNQSRTPVYFSHYPGTSSLKNFAHWGQMIFSDQTRMYDYGSPIANVNRYLQTSPPMYPFHLIRDVPIHLFYSLNDFVATAIDVEWETIGKQLDRSVVKEYYHIPGYSHNDFIAGATVKPMILDRIIDLIRRYDGFYGCVQRRKTEKMPKLRFSNQ